MSALRPPAKQAKMNAQTSVKRTESIPLSQQIPDTPEENTLPTFGSHVLPEPTTAMKTGVEAPSHPKGHKIRTVKEIWDSMDPARTKQFLRLTDTTALGDVWVQPKIVTRTSPIYLAVTFAQIISAPHMHIRDVTYQMSADDLLKLFFLADSYVYAIEGKKCVYDDWLTEKVNKRNTVHGLEGSEDRALLCEFIWNEDDSFSVYPLPECPYLSVFFRKICYHSYHNGDRKEDKVDNPSMVKCQAVRGKFEYMYEAKLTLLPEQWGTPK